MSSTGSSHFPYTSTFATPRNKYMTMILPFTISALLGLTIAACSPATDGNENSAAAIANQPSNTVDNPEEGVFAKIQTNKGLITIKLEC